MHLIKIFCEENLVWLQKFLCLHRVWKSEKKSHSTLRAKRAYILSRQKFKNGTFWRVLEKITTVDVFKLLWKSTHCSKNAKNWSILRELLKTWSLQSNSVTRQITFNFTKIGGKCQNHYSRCFLEFLEKTPNCSKYA